MATVSTGTTTTLALAGNPARTSAAFVNTGPATVFLYGDGYSSGLPVAPGGSYTDSTGVAAWWALSYSAGQLTVAESTDPAPSAFSSPQLDALLQEVRALRRAVCERLGAPFIETHTKG